MKRSLLLLLLLQLVVACCNAQLPVDTTYVRLTSRVLKDSLFIPWEIIFGPDDHIWFTQKNGYICRMDTAGLHTDTLYYEPSTVTIKESGMLGMALHPSFSTESYLYVVFEYLNPAGQIRERIERLTYSTTNNTLSAPYILLDSIKGYSSHNGCRLAIAGDKLFMTIADATDTTIPQNLGVINGKILRLNLDGSIPADNPIAGSPIWSWGHRNAQGLVLANNQLYSSEHGDNTDDEINIIKKGGNYGWPYVRGYCDQPWETTFCTDSPVVAPLQAWTPCIAPCGIDYYHHPMFLALQNSLLLTTLKNKHLYRLSLNDTYDAITAVSVIEGIDYGRLRDICISPDGKIYLSTSNSDANDTGVKKDRIVVVYSPDQPTLKMLLYPSPSSDLVYISLPTIYTTLHVILTDITGRKVMDGTLTSGKPKIDVKSLSMGIYMVNAETETGMKFTGKFVRK